MPEHPPKLAEFLLRWLVGGRDADAVAGDLRESFAERGGGLFWYWRQAVSCVAVRFSLHRRMLPGLGQDFHHALRMVRRNPGYAFTAMLCLALAMGVWSGTGKLFEAVYIIWWYIGPVHHDRNLDFMFTSPRSLSWDVLRFYLLAAFLLFGIALLGRRRQIQA